MQYPINDMSGQCRAQMIDHGQDQWHWLQRLLLSTFVDAHYIRKLVLLVTDYLRRRFPLPALAGEFSIDSMLLRNKPFYN